MSVDTIKSDIYVRNKTHQKAKLSISIEGKK